MEEQVVISKKRKGFTLVETVVAFSLFTVILSAVLSTAYTSFRLSKEVTDATSQFLQARIAVDYIQRQFESIQRMGPPGEDYPNFSSSSSNTFDITFKRSTENSSYWAKISGAPIENPSEDQNTYSINMGVQTDSSGNFNNYTILKIKPNFKIDFYSSSNIHVASNNKKVPVVEGINTTTGQLWKMRMSFQFNNTFLRDKSFVFSTVREVSPLFNSPTIVGSPATNVYTFSIPLDTEKSSTVVYNNNYTVTGSVSSTTIKNISSYLGSPAVVPTQINCEWFADREEYRGQLLTCYVTDAHPIANAIIYIFDKDNNCYSVATDDNGNFVLHAPYIADLYMFYAGTESFAPCWAVVNTSW